MKSFALVITTLAWAYAHSASAEFRYYKIHDGRVATIKEEIIGTDDTHQIGLSISTRNGEQVIYKENAIISLENLSNLCKSPTRAFYVSWEVANAIVQPKEHDSVTQPWNLDKYGLQLIAPKQVTQAIFISVAGRDRIIFQVTDGCGEHHSYSFSLAGLPLAVMQLNFTNPK
jgi:hypothetical protein